MLDIASGHAAIDRYLADSYKQVRGMSSRFAAAICGFLIQRQSALGSTGALVEIGTFEGRFFIAMGLGLAPGEIALGIDRFDWPNAGVEGRFLANCARHGLARERFISWKTDSRDITSAALGDRLGQPIRFVHIDSHHSRACLTSDLALVHPLLHEAGVICLDDMLHPGYPLVVTAVYDYLARHPEMRLMCVIDREDIVAAPKFLLCREAWFARFQFTMGADMESYVAVVLTPQPRLAEVE